MADWGTGGGDTGATGGWDQGGKQGGWNQGGGVGGGNNWNQGGGDTAAPQTGGQGGGWGQRGGGGGGWNADRGRGGYNNYNQGGYNNNRGGFQPRGGYNNRGGFQQRGGYNNRGGFQQRGGYNNRGNFNNRGGGPQSFRQKPKPIPYDPKKNGWGDLVPDSIDKMIEYLEVDATDPKNVVIMANIEHVDRIRGTDKFTKQHLRLEEIMKLSGSQVVIHERGTKKMHHKIVVSQGNGPSCSVENAVWLMNICINAFVRLDSTLAWFDPVTPLQDVVTSEVYGKPPGMNKQDESKDDETQQNSPPPQNTEEQKVPESVPDEVAQKLIEQVRNPGVHGEQSFMANKPPSENPEQPSNGNWKPQGEESWNNNAPGHAPGGPPDAVNSWNQPVDNKPNGDGGNSASGEQQPGWNNNTNGGENGWTQGADPNAAAANGWNTTDW